MPPRPAAEPGSRSAATSRATGPRSVVADPAGLERVDSGSITIAGQRIESLDEDALATFRREKVGIVFQSFHLMPTMTALENVAIPLELAGVEDPFGRATCELEMVGLASRASHYPSQLSGGEQQRVAIARALVNDPELVLADEPTGNLDESTGAQIVDLLLTQRVRKGSTLIMVTHDAGLATKCDAVVSMRSGLVESLPGRLAQSVAP